MERLIVRRPAASLPRGKKNDICDVPGVRVGHYTLDTDTHHTGVTVVLPCSDNPFTQKLTAASHVVNGFGKTAGLVQVEELGTLETPLALTNTLNVGCIHDALVRYTVERCEKEGVEATSVNPVVLECNDAFLNDIRDPVLGADALNAAMRDAKNTVAQGAVGAGRGMTCFGLKGGIGSASRVVTLGERDYTVGVLTLCNHGASGDLMIGGQLIGEKIARQLEASTPDKGSCIIVLATDLPVSDRQLHRIIKRCAVGLIRTGSYLGHGSGDIAIGFTTRNRVTGTGDVQQMERMNEDKLNPAFRAAAEAAEEAVVNALWYAKPLTGYRGHTRRALSEFVELM